MDAQKEQKQKVKGKDYLFTISTRLGDIHLIVFDETPKHKANFLKLVEEQFYDGTIFHRVIPNFMVQGGDGATKVGGQAVPPPSGPDGWNDENSVEAEIIPTLSHKKGALAAARMGDRINPQKRSSISQFYIVQSANGTPHLDGGYTVFGQALDGLDVVDKIAMEKTARGDRPVEPIPMTITVEKIKKKKIQKIYGYQY